MGFELERELELANFIPSSSFGGKNQIYYLNFHTTRDFQVFASANVDVDAPPFKGFAVRLWSWALMS